MGSRRGERKRLGNAREGHDAPVIHWRASGNGVPLVGYHAGRRCSREAEELDAWRRLGVGGPKEPRNGNTSMAGTPPRFGSTCNLTKDDQRFL
jgi:hypothetical protein